MSIYDDCFEMQELLDRGWSIPIIKNLYGDPSHVLGLGINKKAYRYYKKSDVFKIESSFEFKFQKHKYGIYVEKKRLKKTIAMVNGSVDYCKRFKFEFKDSPVQEIANSAVRRYVRTMVYKTGQPKMSNGTKWSQGINETEFQKTAIDYIKEYECNYNEAAKYIDNLRVAMRSFGLWFVDYNACFRLLNCNLYSTISLKYQNLSGLCKKLISDSGYANHYLDSAVLDIVKDKL